MNIDFVISTDIYDYKPLLEGLIDDFGYIYYHSILQWCGILDKEKDKFWRNFLIKKDNAVIGICALYSPVKDKTDELWLGWFAVLPQYRNKGIGKIALDFMVSEARKIGCNKILSYVDKEGKPLSFYNRYGFKVIDTVGSYLAERPYLNKDYFESNEDFIIEMNI